MTLACFQILGIFLLLREQLNRSQRGRESGSESSFRIRLFIRSGPAALPRGSDFKTCFTSPGVTERESRLWSGIVSVSGRFAWLSSCRVFSIKNNAKCLLCRCRLNMYVRPCAEVVLYSSDQVL